VLAIALFIATGSACIVVAAIKQLRPADLTDTAARSCIFELASSIVMLGEIEMHVHAAAKFFL